MGYLFADSEPFPLDFDFLATLRAIVTAATKTYSYLGQTERLQAEIEGRNQGTQYVLASLANFASALEAARAAAQQHYVEVVPVLAYSHELKEHLERTGIQAREVYARANEEQNQIALAQIVEHRAAMRVVIEEFILTAQLTMEPAYARTLLKDEGGYELLVGATTQGPIEIDFGVSTERLSEWKEPRRVEALAGGLILQVGMRKKFLRKDLTRELLDVSDYVVAQAGVHPGGGEIHLRRKASSTKDQVVISLRRADGGLAATIVRPDEEAGAPFVAEGEELVRIDRLFQALEASTREALPKRDSVRGVRLDGREVFEQELGPQLFDRLIEIYAPMVKEIARRSPSPRELSLKLQRDDGRREELYLRKSELAEEIAPLSAEKRARFAALNLS